MGVCGEMGQSASGNHLEQLRCTCTLIIGLCTAGSTSHEYAKCLYFMYIFPITRLADKPPFIWKDEPFFGQPLSPASQPRLAAAS